MHSTKNNTLFLFFATSAKLSIQSITKFYSTNYLNSGFGITNYSGLNQKFLTNRKQYVFSNGKGSNLCNISIGVPQGSILGPILFLLYINDLPNASALTFLLFADDTTILASGPNIENLINYVNQEFQKVVYFFRQNKLALHANKTNYMIFSTSPEVRNSNFQLFINNNNPNQQDPSLLFPLTRVLGDEKNPAVKFLGVYIDPSLNFKHHILTLCNKLSSSLYFLRATKKVLSPKALSSVYYSLIHSHLVYCIHIWSCCPSHSLNTVFKKQKIAIRLINNAAYNAHTESLFKKSKILPLPTLCEYFKIQFVHQFLHNKLPISFANVWTTNLARRTAGANDVNLINNNANPYVLRNSDDLFIPPSRIALLDKFPLYLFPHLWVSLDNQDVKMQNTKITFNKLLKEHFLQKLSDNYICERLLCPHCLLR